MNAGLIEEARKAVATIDGSVLLFGSQARGDAHEDSDVDLLVVSDRPPTTPVSPDGCHVIHVLPHEWESQRRFPGTLEGNAARDGMWLKQTEQLIDWRKVMSPDQAWHTAVNRTVHSLRVQSGQIYPHLAQSPDEQYSSSRATSRGIGRLFLRGWVRCLVSCS